ncbi:hypothetical protein MACK_002585 [Theileria orientalis]|uniref:CPW-WPC domain-containing protein n=1 Tax=Theileria orientalis TaxID=68886 RepID=A0A976QV24_THEOR|nr:hypothetical protein MACK_002585 [Theileria orientalis]
MIYKSVLVPLLFFNFVILSESSVLFDTLKNIIENKQVDDLDELRKAALEVKIRDSISRASEILDLENFESSECEPDFTLFCPEKWTYMGDGLHCKANPEYSGSCDKMMDFSDKTPLEKLNLSRECSFSWPCKANKPTYIPNKVTQCPKFWSFKGNSCVPHDSYLGVCSELSLEELERNKNELTVKCNLSWDNTMFKTSNLLDLSGSCPLGYTGSEFCTPLDNFSPKFQGIIHFENREDKLIKTDLYNLSWNFEMNNEQHLDEKCPYQWTFDQDTNLCLAPPSYKGPCQVRFDFSKMNKRLKNIWSVVCLVDFFPGEEVVKESLKVSTDKMYKDGAIESRFKILKRRKVNEKDTPIEILQKQLKELYKLRKKSTNDNFLSTLQFTIDKLEKRILAPSFLQIDSNITTKKYECPYNWDQFENICIAPKTYQAFVPNCYNIISRFTQKSNESCRLQFNDDHVDNEDFVREPCPLGWKYDTKLDGRILRTICRPKIGQINYNFSQCGTKVDFTNVSPKFKRNWAFACNVKFPSRSHKSETKCKQNYFRKCPYGWEEVNDSCIAPSTYFGPCDKSVKFSEIATPDSKKSFSQRCLAFWDCLGNCEKDYTNVCPKNWKYDGTKCTATYKYDFPCKSEFVVPKTWNEFSKQEFEFVCQAYWDCKS